MTFMASNTPDYLADSGFLPSRAYLPEILKNSSGGLLSAMKASLSTFSSPAGYLNLLLDKTQVALNAFEKPNNVNFYYYTLHTPVLKYLPVGFTVLFSLGALGFLLSVKSIKRSWPLYLFLLSCVAPLIIFYPLSRFRVIAYPVLALFAALALVWLFEKFRSRDILSLILASLLLIPLGLYTSTPRPANEIAIRSTDYASPFKYYYKPFIEAARKAKNEALAAELFEEAFRTAPNFVREARAPKNFSEKSMCYYYNNVYRDYSVSLTKTGRDEEAKAALAFADQLYEWAKED